MKKQKSGIVLTFLVILLGGILFTSYMGNRLVESSNSGEESYGEETIEVSLPKERIEDNNKIYDEFNDSSIQEFFVTVLPPKDEGVTFQNLNENVNETNDVYHNDIDDPYVEIYFSEKSDMVSFEQEANATMEIRGQSSRLAPQKSYKIKLDKDKMLWNGMNIINLNKHFSDALRIRNKLSFDYFKMIPDITSYRTKFIKLNIRDLSNGEDKGYESYGLFTFIEQPNHKYLKDHGLDQNGHFYKAEFFEFRNVNGDLKTKEDPDYSAEKFESIVETRGNDDHSKLIEMLDAVNDYSIDINDIVEKYFDRENMLTWVASNILFNNYDTSSRNFLIYSPLNSDTWYFVPWDYDKAWEPIVGEDGWEFGLSNYWGMTLFNRFFRDEENFLDLNKKIEELSKIVTPDKTETFLHGYYNQIKDVIFSYPDKKYIKYDDVSYMNELQKLVNMPYANKANYYKDIERPMPFFLHEIARVDSKIQFTWDASFDLQGESLTYEFILSRNPQMTDIVTRLEGLKETYCTIDNLKSGKYYWRVVARDSNGNYRMPFDAYAGEVIYKGVKEAIISE